MLTCIAPEISKVKPRSDGPVKFTMPHSTCERRREQRAQFNKKIGAWRRRSFQHKRYHLRFPYMTCVSWRTRATAGDVRVHHIRLPREPSGLRRSQVIRLYWCATNGTGGVYRLDEVDALARASDRDGSLSDPYPARGHAKVTAFGPHP